MPFFPTFLRVQHVVLIWILLKELLVVQERRVATVVLGKESVAQDILVFTYETHLVKRTIVLEIRLWRFVLLFLDSLGSLGSSKQLVDAIVHENQIVLWGSVLLDNAVHELVYLLPINLVHLLWSNVPSDFFAFSFLHIVNDLSAWTILEWLIPKYVLELAINFDLWFSMYSWAQVQTWIGLIVNFILYSFTTMRYWSSLTIYFFFLLFRLQKVFILKSISTGKVTYLNGIIDILNSIFHLTKVIEDFVLV